MHRVAWWGVAVVLHIALIAVAALGPVLVPLLGAEDLPDPYPATRPIICIMGGPPGFDLRAWLLDSTEREVQAFLGDDQPVPESHGVARRRCVRYAFTNGAHVTILFRQGRAAGAWLGGDEPPSGACEEVLNRATFD